MMIITGGVFLAVDSSGILKPFFSTDQLIELFVSQIGD